MDAMTAAVALLAAFGLAALLWLLLGWLLFPVGSRRTASVQLTADQALEQNLKGLDWLNRAGLLEARVTVLDTGLLPEERTETLRLLARWPGVELVETTARERTS